MKKLCIFDLDGTLMNTLDTIGGYMNIALAEEGFLPFAIERYKYFVGNGAKKLVERALTAQNAMTEEGFARVFARYNRLYDAAPNANSMPYEGVLPLLTALKERGVKAAVLSNKPDFAARAVVDSFFGPLVTVAHGGRDTIPLKPAPDGVFAILKELDTVAEDCLYIGDTGVDMETGNAAGIFTVGVTWGFRERAELMAHGAQAVIDHPSQLLSYLEVGKKG